MFLALRDIRRATGRFTLIGSVVALITLLLVMLTGLTSGLGNQNTSAIESLDAESVVFSPEVSFPESRIDPEVAQAYGDATPLAISQQRLDDSTAVAVLSLPAGTAVPGGTIPEGGALTTGELQGVFLGDLPVTGHTDEEFYSHQPVVWADIGSATPSVLLLDHEPSGEVPGSVVVSGKDALAGLPAYQSERGSLLTMQALLYGISALVIIAFLSVWTIQRTRDIAVLRALGASKSYVLKDSVGQAMVILAVGTGLGALVGAGLGALAAGAVPFILSPGTVLLPALGVFVIGMGGALIATRRVAKVDPQIALGANV